MDERDPRQLLARRLRSLREQALPGRRVTQPELAKALGGDRPKALSVPLISSWESATRPRIPPASYLERYAALFAAPRSFEAKPPRVLSVGEMTDEERQVMGQLRSELTELRHAALRATAGTSQLTQQISVEESLNAGPWRFADGNTITVVCAKWPQDRLGKLPYSSRDDPDYVDSHKYYSELDALIELYGHLRAANPANQVNLRTAGELTADDYTSHLVSLGGVDWNTATTNSLLGLQLPVRQVAEWDTAGGQYFEVEEGGKPVRHRADLDTTSLRGAAGQPVAAEKGTLREDIALFARAVSPFNRKRTVSICSGMYGRGTYGAVRALTDAKFRDRNAEYLQSRFGGSEAFCVLTRVHIVEGETLTPDWTQNRNILFEWSR